MRSTPTVTSGLLFLAIAASLSVAGTAQCQLTWQPGAPITVPSGRVLAVVTLANRNLLAAGWFVEAGSVIANNVARWDGSQWHAFGLGVDDQINHAVVLPNGDVIVAGKFQLAGGAPASHVARWNGSTWLPLGPGLNGEVLDLELMPDGNVIAVGSFEAAGASLMGLVAQWDGAGRNWDRRLPMSSTNSRCIPAARSSCPDPKCAPALAVRGPRSVALPMAGSARCCTGHR